MNGNIRPSRFFVVAGSKRTVAAAKSTCAHVKRSTSLSLQPVMAPKVSSGFRATGRCRLTASTCAGSKTWDQIFVEERPTARQTLERVDTVTVEAEETVTVPAGTFKTLKVVYRNEKNGTIRYEAWYSLDLKQVVKLWENLETGLRVRELIAFKLRER